MTEYQCVMHCWSNTALRRFQTEVGGFPTGQFVADMAAGGTLALVGVYELSECLDQEVAPSGIFFSTGGADPDSDLVVALMKEPEDIFPDPNDVVANAVMQQQLANGVPPALADVTKLKDWQSGGTVIQTTWAWSDAYNSAACRIEWPDDGSGLSSSSVLGIMFGICCGLSCLSVLVAVTYMFCCAPKEPLKARYSMAERKSSYAGVTAVGDTFLFKDLSKPGPGIDQTSSWGSSVNSYKMMGDPAQSVN
eukprot:gene4611-4820_t